MIKLLLSYGPTVLSTLLTLKDVIKTQKPSPVPHKVPSPIPPAPHKVPSGKVKPHKVKANANMDKAGLFMSLIAFIPPEFYKFFTEVVLGIITNIFNLIFKIIRGFSMVTFVIFSLSLLYSVYSFHFLKCYKICIPLVSDSIKYYLPTLNPEVGDDMSYVILIILSLFLIWFIYNIMFHKKQVYGTSFAQNGYGIPAPSKETAWGKAYLIIFYLSCISGLIYIGLFFTFTLPALILTYGVIKTPVVQLVKNYTEEDKLLWLNDLKVILVDTGTPTRVINETLNSLSKMLSHIHTPNELLVAANTLVNKSFTAINAELKLSFWTDVVMQHKLAFLGLAIIVFIGISYIAYWKKDLIAHDRAVNNAQHVLTKKCYTELAAREDYLAATLIIQADAIKRNGAITAEIVEQNKKFHANVQGMLQGDFWKEIKEHQDNVLALIPTQAYAIQAVSDSVYKVSGLDERIKNYPVPEVIAACKGLRYQTVINRPKGILQTFLQAMEDIANWPIEALRLINAESTAKAYEARLAADHANFKPPTPLLEWLTETYPAEMAKKTGGFFSWLKDNVGLW